MYLYIFAIDAFFLLGTDSNDHYQVISYYIWEFCAKNPDLKLFE